MATPVWVTPSGSLGTITENVFYQTTLSAVDPENPNNPVKFLVIAGQLPTGVECTITGLVRGVPRALDRDLTNKFVVRAYTEKVVNGVTVVDRFRDQTFFLTISIQNFLRFVTPSSLLFKSYDGSPVTPFQIEVETQNITTPVKISLISGSLPPGLTVSTQGLISGNIDLLDPNTAPGITTYQFVLQASAGEIFATQTYQIAVYCKAFLSADTNKFTADDTFITADVTPAYLPYLLNAAPSNLGVVRSDNFWAYKFEGFSVTGALIEYEAIADGVALRLPPGTVLDPVTGWLYGYIPDIRTTQDTYNFGLFLKNADDPTIRSFDYFFSVTLIGQQETEIIWISDPDLGVINNGDISTLAISAVSITGRQLQFQLKPGLQFNQLPQGLELLPDGEIVGRVSFNTFAIDSGTTTFDKNIRTRLIINETTFDLSFTFTVNAFTTDGIFDDDRTFTITVNREYNQPYENLYIKAMPPFEDRDFINQIIQNQDIIPVDLLYRPSDPYFGVAKSVIYEHAFGLTSATYSRYVESLIKNHYWKNLVLGEIKTAQALDQNNRAIYEVVYSEIQDDLINDQGQSVSKSVVLPYTTVVDGETIQEVYPNSLINMRDQVIDTVGQLSSVLPRWMTSKQADGKVLGFVPAWVICYCKPGAARRIAYNIQQNQFDVELNRIDFDVDRYELDRQLSKNWDPEANQGNGAWVPTPAATTFDLELHYAVSGMPTLGVNYNIGDQILVLGSSLGGLSPLNDVTITVQDIDMLGAITELNLTGIAPLLSFGNVYADVSGVNVVTGLGAEFTVKRINLQYVVTVTDPGVGYKTGDRIVILGSELGGVDSVNDCVISITKTVFNGNISEIASLGTAVSGVETYVSVSGDKINGSGATFNFVVVSGNPTIFDKNSMRFIAPVDNFTITDSFDKYLVFPRRNILV
jgi:hypothetical protein